MNPTALDTATLYETATVLVAELLDRAQGDDAHDETELEGALLSLAAATTNWQHDSTE